MALGRFLSSGKERCTLVINGYAGTGKTTLMHALVGAFPALNLIQVLLAPTGRAAKVLSNYTGKPAYTIHKKIYGLKSEAAGFASFVLLPNKHKNTVFIVDEASMIGMEEPIRGMERSGNLLEDLLDYVFSGDNCRLILLGDNAQLPPVHFDKSPALDVKMLREIKDLTVAICTMEDVVRQNENSGILMLATAFRKHLNKENNPGILKFPPAEPDVERLGGAEFPEVLEDCFNKYGSDQCLVITRSNKRAWLFNQQIRHRIFWREERLNAGDMVMIVKNNYFWLEKSQGFIANGEIAEVLKVDNYEEKYGFTFANVVLKLSDFEGSPELSVKLILNTLESESANLTSPESKRLREEIEENYLSLGSKAKIREALKSDPYLNALQVKFAYAVTCHKSQGGQWDCVFVDQGYVTDEMVDRVFWRWLYTAVTRATTKLYLVNFNPLFFEEQD